MSQAKITLNYSMSLAEMLTICAPIAKVDPVATEMVAENYFPIEGTGEVATPFLEKLSYEVPRVGSEKARTVLTERGLRPATFPEMLMFMANNPEEATEHSIVSLNPVTITPTGRFKDWHGAQQQPFVATIINHERFHDGSRLVNPGKPKIWLAKEWGLSFGNRCSMDWHFAVMPE